MLRWLGVQLRFGPDRYCHVREGLLRPRGIGLACLEGKRLPGELVGEMLLEAEERRCGAVEAVPSDHALEFLSDNGTVYIAPEAWALARARGLKPTNTPSVVCRARAWPRAL